jgi:hypothetical protein
MTDKEPMETICRFISVLIVASENIGRVFKKRRLAHLRETVVGIEKEGT